MGNNIGYHTRLYGNHSVKCCGGSFGGAIDQDTVERLVKSQFSVIVKDSGTAVFVDKQGREVRLYLSVDPDTTTAGKAALKEWYRQRDIREEKYREQREAEQREIDGLLDGLSHDEIVRRLKGVQP